MLYYTLPSILGQNQLEMCVVFDVDMKVLLDSLLDEGKNKVLMEFDFIFFRYASEQLFSSEGKVVFPYFSVPIVSISVLEQKVNEIFVLLDASPDLLKVSDLSRASKSNDMSNVIDIAFSIHGNRRYHISDDDVVKGATKDSFPNIIDILSSAVGINLMDDRRENDGSRARSRFFDYFIPIVCKDKSTSIGTAFSSSLTEHLWVNIKSDILELGEKSRKKVDKCAIGTSVVDDDPSVNLVHEEDFV